MNEQSRVEIFCSLKGQTENAILVNDGDRDVWIPKSLMTEEQRFEELPEWDVGDSFELSIPEWFADQKELI